MVSNAGSIRNNGESMLGCALGASGSQLVGGRQLIRRLVGGWVGKKGGYLLEVAADTPNF